MRFNTKRVQAGKPIQPNVLYQLSEDQEIRFEEKETKDVVLTCFKLTEGQYGLYGEEYKPDFVHKDGAKRVDLLAFVIDEAQKKCAVWVLDVKETVGGAEVIEHLFEQLEDSYRHQKALMVYLEDCQQELHLGFITRRFDQEWIKRDCETLAFELRDAEQLDHVPILRAKRTGGQERVRRQLSMLQQALRQEIELYDGKTLPLEFHQSVEENGNYVCRMTVSCDAV